MLTDSPSAPLVLIVEDDEDHEILIRRSFDSSAEEYRLVTAMHLRDARQVLAQQKPDLILADYCLPDGKGCDLLKTLDGACPIVIMTSQGDNELEKKVKEAGASDYVVKSLEGFASMPCIVNAVMRQWAGS
jgi:DNA-binding response OmpR family regulator